MDNAKKQITRYIIEDLNQECKEQGISKSRVNNLINYYKKGLGEGKYCCISAGNDIAKHELSIDINYKELEEKLNSLSEEEKNTYKELKSKLSNINIKNVGLTAPDMFGKRNFKSYLSFKYTIGFYNGKCIPVIRQGTCYRNLYDDYYFGSFGKGEFTYYINLKDVA